jgi:hypothetical protein
MAVSPEFNHSNRESIHLVKQNTKKERTAITVLSFYQLILDGFYCFNE